MPIAGFSIQSPTALWIAAGSVALVLLVALIRRPDLPRVSLSLILAGLLLLVLSAGDVSILRRNPGKVAVMVDLSPSTRTAAFRDREWLGRRIDALVGPTPHQVIYFAHTSSESASGIDVLADMPAEKTRFAPPAAPAALLFSDGQFELPLSAPPVYPAVDPILENTADSAIEQLTLRDSMAVADVRNGESQARTLRINQKQQSVPPGRYTLTRSLDAGTQRVSAEIAAEDAWPENDALALQIPPPGKAQRWWVSSSPAPAGFESLALSEIPVDPAAWLSAGLIVLDNVPAGVVSLIQQQRLEQYVRDLGGALLILGGDSAFAAGGYIGTTLEDLSPLASAPPQPTIHWILLADSSGSMAAPVDGGSRWDVARRALLQLIPLLPAADPLTIGNFAERLTLWSTARPAGETARLNLPPTQIVPSGPTNLEPALQSILASASGNLPRQLLIVSDADTEIAQPQELIGGLKLRRITLNLLAIGRGRGLETLRTISRETGGVVIDELDPTRWVSAAQQLLQASSPDHLLLQPQAIVFGDQLAGVGPITTAPVNRTWQKDGTELLAWTVLGDESIPAAAAWNVGTGRVLAAAFPARDMPVPAMADLIARPVSDPRLRVSWSGASKVTVHVDATDSDGYLNGLNLTLDLIATGGDAEPRKVPIAQIAPGAYSATFAAPRRPALAVIRHDGNVISRYALPGRYAPEFDAIGNDTDTLRRLAGQTGGRLIAPNESSPIDFHFPTRRISLRDWLAAAGAVMIGLGLLHWRTH